MGTQPLPHQRFSKSSLWLNSLAQHHPPLKVLSQHLSPAAAPMNLASACDGEVNQLAAACPALWAAPHFHPVFRCLRRCSTAAWSSPSLSSPPELGGLSFLSATRKLKRCVECGTREHVCAAAPTPSLCLQALPTNSYLLLGLPFANWCHFFDTSSTKRQNQMEITWGYL